MAAARLRADAERNRIALLAAAREVFSEHGLDASLDEIARRAGVGNATLYRRFPTRQDLIAAVFADRKATHVELGDKALAAPDPWQGFVGYVTGLCELQAENRGLGELLVTADFDSDARLTQLRTTSQRRAREVIQRAKDAGVLRADFDRDDLVNILMSNAGLIERSRDPNAWRRQLTLLLEGCAVTVRRADAM